MALSLPRDLFQKDLNRLFWGWKLASLLALYMAYLALLQLGLVEGSGMDFFSHWDGKHYVDIASNGYNEKTAAFYPLFPYLIKLGIGLTGSAVFSALVINTVAAFFFAYFFTLVASELVGRQNALSALAIFLVFPPALFMHLVYTEVLFLLVLFAFIWLWEFKRSHWVILPSLLLPLTRGQGFFVAVAALVLFVLALRDFRRGLVSARDLGVYAFAGVGFLVGGLLLLANYQVVLGNALAFIDAQNYFPQDVSFKNLFRPHEFLRTLFFEFGGLHNHRYGLLDKLFVGFAFFGLIYVWRMGNRGIFLIALALTYFPATVGFGTSYVRHSLLPFSLLSIALMARFSIGEKAFALPRKLFFRVYFPTSLLVQLGFAGLYIAKKWIG